MSKFDKFKHTNGHYYAWIEVPKEMLQIKVPKDAKWGTKEDGNQKTMAEFTLGVNDTGSGMVLFALAAMEFPTARNRGTTIQDMIEWEYFLASYGFSVDKWLTIDEYKKRIKTDDIT